MRARHRHDARSCSAVASSAIDNRTGIITSLARTVTDGRPIPAASTSSQPALGRMSQGPRSLEAITEPVPFHLLANVMCRPPRRSSVPDGLTILGDSQSSLNLIDGHGTTLAALGHRPFRTTLLVAQAQTTTTATSHHHVRRRPLAVGHRCRPRFPAYPRSRPCPDGSSAGTSAVSTPPRRATLALPWRSPASPAVWTTKERRCVSASFAEHSRRPRHPTTVTPLMLRDCACGTGPRTEADQRAMTATITVQARQRLTSQEETSLGNDRTCTPALGGSVSNREEWGSASSDTGSASTIEG